MSFLFPSMLWGLAAVSIPLIIHLISLRHTKIVDFSSIRHIKALENETIRKLKIRQWILIVLRMGIITALVLMVSGPILNNDSPWIPSENESTIVIIIDNSASMAVTRDRQSYLDKVKSELPKLVASFDGLVNLQVYQTTPVKLIYDDIIEEGMAINPANWNIPQTVGRDKIWFVVDSVLKSVTNASVNKECYILSDFPITPPSNFSTDFKDWQFYFIGQEPLSDNVSISNISAVSQIKLPNHLLKLNTKIENMGPIERRNIPVELYINDERVGQIVSHFQPKKSKDFLFQVYPGKSGVIRGKLVISKDDYSFDDIQTFELTIPEQISCKVIANSQDNLFMLKTVLEAISGKDRFLDIELKVMDNIHRVYLDETDVLILQDPKHLTASAIESLKRFLGRGGSILWFSGENYSELNSITQSNLKLPKFIETVRVTGESYFSVDVTDRENPILQELNLRDVSSALPQVYQYNKIENQTGQKNILTINNNDPYFIEIPHSGSQIYYFTSPLDLRWNDFGMKGLLIPLIHRLLILSATNEINTSMVEVGQEKYIKIKKELINKKWSLRTPSGNKILVVPDYNREALIISKIQELGSYEVFAGDEFYTAFSSKLSPFEKPSLRAREDQVISILGKRRSVWIRPGVNIKEVISTQRQGRALWRSFLIIAIACMLLESYLSRMKPEAKKLKS
ncbi:MAG: BatA domain-containing protein [Candidatus Marinimicrobia bacterium]|nr:BatA domain-containing protein [Candidatus Neomarinimicrobiota bacterium]MBL7030908.1 BatA domain-containing protein [Candidatus Neomarinimicrobiota bacterium]